MFVFYNVIHVQIRISYLKKKGFDFDQISKQKINQKYIWERKRCLNTCTFKKIILFWQLVKKTMNVSEIENKVGVHIKRRKILEKAQI